MIELRRYSGELPELAVEIEPGDATEVGVQVLCSPDQAEQTEILSVPSERMLKIDTSRSTLNEAIRYHTTETRAALRDCRSRSGLLTRSVHVHVEGQRNTSASASMSISLWLRYSRTVGSALHSGSIRREPTGTGVRLVSRGGQAHFRSIQAWELAPAI